MSRVSWAERKKLRQQMAELVRDGEAVRHVALRFDVTICTVRNACRENGVTIPHEPKGVKPPVALHFQILKGLMEGGNSYSSLAKKLNRSSHYIKFVAREARQAGFDV